MNQTWFVWFVDFDVKHEVSIHLSDNFLEMNNSSFVLLIKKFTLKQASFCDTTVSSYAFSVYINRDFVSRRADFFNS